MQVILLEKIGRLGDIGDQVDVKSGFGRNFLVPQGKAVPATAENIAMFEERRAELEAASAEKLTAAQGRAKLIEAMSEISIVANASEEGKLFGSVGTREIADAVTAAGQEIEKAEVLLPEGVIREVGEYDIDLQLHANVTTSVKLIISAE
jgi:large subunit ribosomal protein L9